MAYLMANGRPMTTGDVNCLIWIRHQPTRLDLSTVAARRLQRPLIRDVCARRALDTR